MLVDQEQGSHFLIQVWDGLIAPKHVKAMGEAVWLFLWCINRQTSSFGHVLFGNAVSSVKIAKELGVCDRTIRRWIARLEQKGYLKIMRAQDGFVIRVLKAKKRTAGVRTRLSGVGQDCQGSEAGVDNSAPPDVDNSVPLTQMTEGRTDVSAPNNVLLSSFTQHRNDPSVDNSQETASETLPKTDPGAIEKLVYDLAEKKAMSKALGKEPGN